MPGTAEEEFEARLKKLSSDFEFFAHITSHDLRDPLRQARIYTDEILEQIPAEFKDEIKSVNSLIDLVLEKIAILREFSYIANDKREHTEIDLNEVFKNVKNTLAEKIAQFNVKLNIPKMPVIRGNPKRIERLFTTLIDNAIEYNGSEKVKVDIDVKDDGDKYHFTVTDNGIGLDPVYRELVFILFQKLDTEPENLHLGAGLAFAKKIVESHGGEIWYEPAQEQGTIFHFTLAKN